MGHISVSCMSLFFLLLSSTFRTRHDTLQKLAIFFQHSKDDFGDSLDSAGATPTKYSSLLSIPLLPITTALLEIIWLMLKVCQWCRNIPQTNLKLSFSESFNPSVLKSADPPSKCFPESTRVTTSVTVTDNGEAVRRVPLNLSKDTGDLSLLENNKRSAFIWYL